MEKEDKWDLPFATVKVLGPGAPLPSDGLGLFSPRDGASGVGNRVPFFSEGWISG